jgi:hypothetical protein
VAQVIHIPLAFEFRPARGKWGLRTVEIEGWAKDLRKPSLFGYIGSSDDVTVDVLEPGALGGLSGLYSIVGIDREARQLKHPAVIHWSEIPSEIKVTSTPAKSMEKIRGEWFSILACDSLEGTGRTGDAWAMRREFLSLKQDSLALLAFFRKWGIWDDQGLGSSIPGVSTNSRIQNVVFPERIWEAQSAYRAALLSAPDEWLCKGVDPFKGAYATPMYPHFILEHTQCKLAIEATITIDLLRKAKFRKCKRPDCSEVFALESKHKRLYCSQPCAHLESVRKQRRSAARKKAKSKKGA